MNDFNVRKNMEFPDYVQSYFKKIIQPYFDFKSYPSSYKNYFHVLWKKLSKKYPIEAILHDGSKLKIFNHNELRISKGSKKNNFHFDNDLLIINKKNHSEIKIFDWKDNGDIIAVFFNEEYSFLPVKDKIVFDIGANIADTSIYFSLNGAKKVIALEPAPKNFESAKKNIEINNLEEKIELMLAGCSDKKGHIKISSKESGVIYSFEPNKEQEVQVPLLSLEELLKQNSSSLIVLKIDCEGCEYNTILKTSCEILRKFSHIQIEYHFGYKNLKEKLEKCGFKVTLTKPQIGYRLYQQKEKSYFGYIYAERVP